MPCSAPPGAANSGHMTGRSDEARCGARRDPTRRAGDIFVELAAALAGDVDLLELLTMVCNRSAELLHATGATLLVVGQDATLHVIASSSEQMHRLALTELERSEGPCDDACTSGRPILNGSLAEDTAWPHFAPAARAAGFRTVHALPMRHDGRVAGVLCVADQHAASVRDTDARTLQALADIASFAVRQHRALRDATKLAEQLQGALRSRVAIEQAKGVLCERLQLDVDAAFELLRGYSRNHNVPIGIVAQRVLDHRLGAEELRTGARVPGGSHAAPT